MITITTRNRLFAAALALLPMVAQALDMPSQGMSMDEVRKAYGSPARDLGAVGKPPITRWVYDGFTVYFEKRAVIHTVRTQSLGGATAPKTAAPVLAPSYEPAAAAPEPVYETAPVAEPAVAAPIAEEPVPVAAPAITAPALAPEPAAEPAPAPAPAPASGGFRFDPATGRLIIDGDQPPEEPAPAPEPVAEPAAEPAATLPTEEPAADMPADTGMMTSEDPAPAEDAGAPVDEPPVDEPAAEATPEPAAEPAAAPAASSGSALDDSLEFDPETGTFRPRQ
ncbi:MAG: hypothetical protein ACOY33_03795 [Pseudomonadota bacterium]